MADRALTIKQVADKLQLSERSIYRLANDGQIPGFRVGGKTWRFLETQIDEWMAQEIEKTRRQKLDKPKRLAKRRIPPA